MIFVQSASKKLDHMPQSVEEFVEHLSFLSRMGSELPSLEKEYFVVTRLFTIAKDFDVPIQPEELALYQTLMPSFQHLKVLWLREEESGRCRLRGKEDRYGGDGRGERESECV